jgi:hypothetical protein
LLPLRHIEPLNFPRLTAQQRATDRQTIDVISLHFQLDEDLIDVRDQVPRRCEFS